MRFKFIVVALAVSASAAPAFANDVSGGRIEAVIGYDNVRLDVSGLGHGSKSGVLYGIGAGYDFGLSEKVSIGFDTEISDSSTSVKFVSGADSGKLATGRDLYVGGRVTTALSDGFNLYGKLGYTNGRLKGTTTIGGVTTADAANGDGIRAGVGLQAKLGGKSYVGAEYRYSNYEAGFTRNQVAAILGFRF